MGASQEGQAAQSIKVEENNALRMEHRGLFLQLHNMILRVPYLIEDKLGINMRYYCALNTPNTLITLEERRMVKANELDEIKSVVFKEVILIDDPIDIYSKHTLLHDAVVLNREQLFYFLLQ